MQILCIFLFQSLQYLGSTVVKELRGTESTKKSIQKLKASVGQANDEDVLKHGAALTLAICHRGVEFIDASSKVSGALDSARNMAYFIYIIPFQRIICEHEIQNINCACQDSEDLRHFAYITKELDMHYCHVFLVPSTVSSRSTMSPNICTKLMETHCSAGFGQRDYPHTGPGL